MYPFIPVGGECCILLHAVCSVKDLYGGGKESACRAAM